MRHWGFVVQTLGYAVIATSLVMDETGFYVKHLNWPHVVTVLHRKLIRSEYVTFALFVLCALLLYSTVVFMCFVSSPGKVRFRLLPGLTT